MFVHVKLLNGFKQQLTYQVPASWQIEGLTGSLICVPLQKRVELALVTAVFQAPQEPVTFKIRTALSKEEIPPDSNYGTYIAQLGSYYQLEERYFYNRVKHFLKEQHHETEQQESQNLSYDSHVILTDEQKAICHTIKPAISEGTYGTHLVHGVTGSGKTEVYKELMLHALSIGKSVILCLPEVSLAVQFHALLVKQLPAHCKLFSFHSATSVKEKRALWQALLDGQPVIILGVHLPMFLPIPNLGLIIVDEEHEVGFQEKKHPKLNTKEAALMRAATYKIPIVLGSATPSLTSLANVHKRGWQYHRLSKRFSGQFPSVKLVKLTENKMRRNFWITTELQKAIQDRLDKKEQAIIFLNRRGFSFFIQCSACGHIPTCISCSVSLTLHNDHRLKCHYCDYAIEEPQKCTACKPAKDTLLKKGIGTQQVVKILQSLFPHARIERADLDTTVNKKRFKQTVDAFEKGEIDILVGTQTITKGYHFPKVTLVGILWADINLSLPMYNAAEVTLQQLIQVAGRAGRQTEQSEVIVQTMIDHPIYRYLHEVDYAQFYEYEIEKRMIVGYPPCIRLVEIEMKHSNPSVLDQEALTIIDHLISINAKYNLDLMILGPAQPPVHMIKNTHMRKIYIKAAQLNVIQRLYQTIDHNRYQSSIYFTPNPLN